MQVANLPRISSGKRARQTRNLPHVVTIRVAVLGLEGDEPENGERGCRGEGSEGDPAIGAATDLMHRRELRDGLFRFALRHARFFGIGDDSVLPITFAE